MPYILMHMSGNPQTMQDKINYTNFNNDIMEFFHHNILILNKCLYIFTMNINIKTTIAITSKSPVMLLG